MGDNTLTWAILLLIVSLFLSIWVSISLVKIPEGRALLVESFGKYKRTLAPGLNFIPWPVQRPRRDIDKQLYTYTQQRKADARSTITSSDIDGDMTPTPASIHYIATNGLISLAEHMMDPPEIWAIASDNTRLKPDVLVFFAIIDPALAVYGVQNMGESMRLLIESTLRQEIATRDADLVLRSRVDIGAALSNALDEATASWGVKIFRVELQEVVFAPEVQQRLTQAREEELAGRARKVAAEREGEAIVIKSEAERRARLIDADADRQTTLIRAEAEKQRMILDAQGKLEIELMKARGLEAIGAAYQKFGDSLLVEKALQAQVGIAQGLGTNGTTVIVPESVAGLTGALAALSRAWTVPTSTSSKHSEVASRGMET